VTSFCTSYFIPWESTPRIGSRRTCLAVMKSLLAMLGIELPVSVLQPATELRHIQIMSLYSLNGNEAHTLKKFYMRS
jgi:hypothetical protein